MIEYKKIFLNKIKVFFSYFVKFSKNKLILSKIYPKNYIISDFNKRLIIMIIYNKSILLANNKQQKV